MPDHDPKAAALKKVVGLSGLTFEELVARAAREAEAEGKRLDALHDGTPKGEMLDPRSFLKLYHAADGDHARASIVTRRRVAMIGSELPCEKGWEHHMLPLGQCVVFFPDEKSIVLIKGFDKLPVFYCPFHSSVKCPERKEQLDRRAPRGRK